MDDDFEPKDGATSELDDRVEELSERIEQLESQVEEFDHYNGLSLGYGLGMALAVVLSWERNGSILWCIGHGVLSWGYVVYFALTRH
jgi:hypothetical protein